MATKSPRRPDGDLNGSWEPNGDQNKPFWTPLGHHGHLGRHLVAIRSSRQFGSGTCFHLKYITSDWLKSLEIGTHLALHLGMVSLHSSNFLSFLSLKGRYSGTCYPKGPPTMHFYLKFSFTSIIVILFSLYYQTKKFLAARRGLFRGDRHYQPMVVLWRMAGKIELEW